MDIDAAENRIALSLKVFADDMETMLHNKYGIHGGIGTDREHRDAKRLLMEYLGERLTIEINHREKMTLRMDSMAIHEEAIWLYMQGKSSATMQYVTVHNRVLTDFFRTQSNLVMVSTGRKEEGYKLDKEKDKIELTIP
jgi:hypothetical protein